MHIVCPACGSHFLVPEEAVSSGKDISCPFCGKMIVISMVHPAQAVSYEAAGSSTFIGYSTSTPVAVHYGFFTPVEKKEVSFFQGEKYLRLVGIGVGAYYFLLSLNFIALIYSLYLVPTSLTVRAVPFFFIIPLPPFVIGFEITGPPHTAAAYHLILAGIIVFSFYFMLHRDGRELFQGIRRIFVRNEEKSSELVQEFESNSFVLLAEVFMGLIFFNYVFYLILYIFGKTPHVPEELQSSPTYILLYILARASVWEEIICRVLLIGLPLFLFSSLYASAEGNRRESVSPGYNYLFGGGIEITPLSWLLVVFSATVFGLAHSSGWDYYKVIPTTISGLGFGYLFLKKGIHVSIILHFSFDYIGLLSQLTEAPLSQGITAVTGLSILVIFVIGAVVFYRLSLRALGYSLRMFSPLMRRGRLSHGKWG